MRAPRIIIVGAFLLTSVILIILSIRSSHTEHGVSAHNRETSRVGIGALFSFQTPFTLFPPNAIISLTDDNTTSFLARPAAFGPLLPTKGLSGQLWIGSGFGDDSLRQGTVAAGAEGELGCSDVPGWAENSKAGVPNTDGASGGDTSTSKTAAKSKNHKRGAESSPMMERDAITRAANEGRSPTADDGTDDYLHHPLFGSTPPFKAGQQPHTTPGNAKANNHADIQSIQEGAEIAGKVVLLSRGGCGFLEKVKWVQRRGGTALIVGDDQKGGPLIQMYARGDTSNVTIPSVFTSHTTAHLLSSLIPPGSLIEDIVDENGNVAVQVQHSKYPKKSTKSAKVMESLPTFTATTRVSKPTSTSRSTLKSTTNSNTKAPVVVSEKNSWFKSLFRRPKSAPASDSSRPPSSGRLDWVLVNDWNEEDDEAIRSVKSGKKDAEQLPPSNSKSSTRLITGDDFVIGVQDWRDPDLVGSSNAKDTGKKSSKNTKAASTPTQKAGIQATNVPQSKQEAGNRDSGTSGLKGGSITPGSGEYGSTSTEQSNEGVVDDSVDESGFLSKLFGEDSDESTDLNIVPHTGRPSKVPAIGLSGGVYAQMGEAAGHDGLWVTLTPTSSGSPFFDTILVLVVSPLVTLTVVYAMLLLRSRIRRRRWRAPKSVVERLPVRTYHTIASSNSSPRAATPISSSPNTPLLSSSSSRPRPRSRTVSGIPESSDLSRNTTSEPADIPRNPTRNPEHEKGASVSSEWKKYMGKQVECVVCLEEYVDGVSQVMSLPCGHEFHVDCITPWLTTRRRTCPICKGDVVRSLARNRNSSSSSPRYEPFRDDDNDDDDIQAQAAQTVNDSSSANLPITRDDDDADLERGIASPNRRNERDSRPRIWRASSWMNSITSGFGRTSRNGSRNQEDDRSR